MQPQMALLRSNQAKRNKLCKHAKQSTKLTKLFYLSNTEKLYKMQYQKPKAQNKHL